MPSDFAQPHLFLSDEIFFHSNSFTQHSWLAALGFFSIIECHLIVPMPSSVLAQPDGFCTTVLYHQLMNFVFQSFFGPYSCACVCVRVQCACIFVCACASTWKAFHVSVLFLLPDFLPLWTVKDSQYTKQLHGGSSSTETSSAAGRPGFFLRCIQMIPPE